MARTFNPAPFQPLQPFFSLHVAGLDKIYEDPNTPMRMEMIQTRDGIFTVTFNLFDEAGWEVEPYIWQSRDPNTSIGGGTGVPGGTFDFGWLGQANVKSDPIPFDIESYTPVYEKNAFAINLHGTGLLGPTLSNNQFSGTVKECIQQWADVYKIDVKYEPDIDESQMQDKGTTDTVTRKGAKKVSKPGSISDWGFLLQLCDYLVSQDGKMGYRPLITADKSGKRQLVLSIPQNTSADYDFYVQDSEQSGVVLNWSPHVQFAIAVDAYETHHNSIQSGTGYPMKVVLDPAVTKDKQPGLFNYNAFQSVRSTKPEDAGKPDKLIQVCPENYPKSVTQGNIRARTSGCISSLGGVSPALTQHIQQWMLGQTAEITIMGDPNISLETLKVANVYFYYPENYLNSNIRQLHYTSGLYYVDGVRHLIEEGRFETTLSLCRAAMPDYPTDPSSQSGQGQGGGGLSASANSTQ